MIMASDIRKAGVVDDFGLMQPIVADGAPANCQTMTTKKILATIVLAPALE
jgi:hypothetical protein